MNGLGTALTAVFAFCLVALVAELVYVLWWRRRFRRRTVHVGMDPEAPGDLFVVPSKELLYFFCWKSQSNRVEPAGASPGQTEAEGQAEAADDDLAKWQVVYGPSRILYTIKEEEREGVESSEYSADSEAKNKRVSLRDAFGVSVLREEASVTAVEEADEQEATPFSTPCASPPYYTPSPSPTRDSLMLDIINRHSSLESGASVEEDRKELV